MRVTLVHPSGFNFVPGQPDFTVLANRMAPIGILALAAWLEKHGVACSVYDCMGPTAPSSTEAQVEQILASKPDIVGFSATSSGFLDAIGLAGAIKQREPRIITIAGNVHASAVGAPLLGHFPELDYLCLGEGEGPLLDLAQGRDPSEIANLGRRDAGGRPVANPRRSRIQDLDSLPFPAYEKLAGFPKGYHLPLFSYRKHWGATMITSRGCPYTCSFCDRTVFERLYKHNSAAYIYEHMRLLRDRYGVHHINFYDDLFTAQKARIHELCEMLIRRPLGMEFNCAIRAGHTDDEMLRLLKRAGALMVSLGIESADPAMMKRHKAGVSLDAVRETVEKIHAAGLRAKGLFIFGLPGETPETLRTTSDYVLSLDLDDMNMTKFSPMFGAPIWNECIGGESGSFREDWRLLNCLNFVFKPAGFSSVEEMDALYNWHVKRFYESPGYRRRFAKRLWDHRWSLLHMAGRLPAFLKAARYFSRGKKQFEANRTEFPFHPRQPQGMAPCLSEELRADARLATTPDGL